MTASRDRGPEALVGTVSSGARNGLPGFHDYRYRGKLTLEAECPFECRGGCGRRVAKIDGRNQDGICAVCRGSYWSPGRCESCGFKTSSARHQRRCVHGERAGAAEP